MLNVQVNVKNVISFLTINLKCPCFFWCDYSGNWMWAAKLPGEGAKMYEACQAMCDFMSALSIAVDGGKDSLSMAARIKGTFFCSFDS